MCRVVGFVGLMVQQLEVLLFDRLVAAMGFSIGMALASQPTRWKA